jgi:hypothetical protein
MLLREGITLTLKPTIRSQQFKLVHWKSWGEEQAPNSMEVENPEITEFFPPNTAAFLHFDTALTVRSFIAVLPGRRTLRQFTIRSWYHVTRSLPTGPRVVSFPRSLPYSRQ